jgi:hypothetical protein
MNRAVGETAPSTHQPVDALFFLLPDSYFNDMFYFICMDFQYAPGPYYNLTYPFSSLLSHC